MNPIEQNALYILKILVEMEINGASGKKIKEETDFDAETINDAIDYLEDLNAVDVLKAVGTAPYNFHSVIVTSRGRYLYFEIFSDQRGSIIDEHSISGFNSMKSLPKRPFNILGSPYGFTEDDWESATLMKKDQNHLNVVFGLQYESNYYNTDQIIKVMKEHFGESIVNFNSKNDDMQVELTFEKLTAGFGEHLFNNIARKIIGSDIAIFEVSDHNPNVMIELGVALTWGIRVLPLRNKDSPIIPSDISGHTWIGHENLGKNLEDTNFQEKLDLMVERTIRMK
nr:hypothetical protein [uncultured Methanobacterium sp.]